jgi:hypothetical protein
VPRLNNPDYKEQLMRLSESVEPVQGHRFLKRILQARASKTGSANRLLLYESLLVEWAGMGRLHETTC